VRRIDALEDVVFEQHGGVKARVRTVGVAAGRVQVVEDVDQPVARSSSSLTMNSNSSITASAWARFEVMKRTSSSDAGGSSRGIQYSTVWKTVDSAPLLSLRADSRRTPSP